MRRLLWMVVGQFDGPGGESSSLSTASASRAFPSSGLYVTRAAAALSGVATWMSAATTSSRTARELVRLVDHMLRHPRAGKLR